MKLENKKILIVDDEPGIIDVVKFELELSGAKVFEASSCNKALDFLKNSSVDLVLSDIRMSDGDGVELLQNLKNLDFPPLIIMMTGFTDNTIEELKSLGAKEVISKPIEWTTFHKIIEDLA